ncbi:hypothetical protein SLEP1_g1197 [Rubroshorea leprosula]|uniref:Uncharacterized protein n=1 Tax=Rubroshorea leprosula TaxID=152421 RepID=A0AAV5HD21_9ROSI|nr:hypothetical protein SLEP1_g1197 [Rubroshorea leprosula]
MPIASVLVLLSTSPPSLNTSLPRFLNSPEMLLETTRRIGLFHGTFNWR